MLPLLAESKHIATPLARDKVYLHLSPFNGLYMELSNPLYSFAKHGVGVSRSHLQFSNMF